MDDLAPAPAQRTFDKVGRTQEDGFASRKKAARKTPKSPDPKPESVADMTPEPDPDHQLDLLA